MPLLDVSFVTQDPMLADNFTVYRREDVVGANGRTTPTVVETFAPLYGVITRQDPNELLRRDDAQSVPNRIFIAAMFAFRGPSREGSVKYQPDQIEFDGTIYTVEKVFSYSRYGAGVYECVALSMNAIDNAPGVAI